ncbi:MAG: hypothetical protein U0792_09750 [Gemmataceae bacterium]
MTAEGSRQTRSASSGSHTITLKVYAHVMPDDDEKLATGAGTLFG